MTSALDARYAGRALATLAIVALLLAACGGGEATPASTIVPTPGPSGTAPTAEPTSDASQQPPTDEPTPTAEPTETDEPTEAPTDEPTATPTDEPTATPGPTAPQGGAAACTGSDDNRVFYAGVADAVAWDVYCPVLPAGWFVETGTFSASRGGKMEISYKGPGGRRIAIREGAYCAGTSDCPPSGSDAGPASFGDRPARLLDVGDGAWLVLDEAGDLNWEARGTGMDGPTLASYTAAFARVGD